MHVTAQLRWRGPSPGRVLLAAGVLLALAGCAGHAARTERARSALDAARPAAALKLYNEELKVDSEKKLPKDTGGDNALLLLDRAMILQQLGEHELSARDLEVSDKQVEMLDFSRSTADEIGRYLFSDDTGPYKSPPYEKLLINTMNMVNYLALGDLNGGRIEARRFAIMQKYLKENKSSGAELMGPGSYLAGFIFEQSNEPQSALRYYDEALQYGTFDTLAEPIFWLSHKASYRTPRISKVLKRFQEQPPAGPDASTAAAESASSSSTELGDVLIVISYGRVPEKIAERVPIGLALTYASGAISPASRARANALAAQGLVTWVNYPTLGKPKGQYALAEFSADGQSQPLDTVPLDKLAIKAWDAQKGGVIASAITRMIARVAAGEVARQAGGKGIGGLLLSLFTQASLTAADTPDTRSWATLPARIALGRVRVPAGNHMIVLKARGKLVKKTLTVKPGGFAVLNLTVLR